MVMVKIRLFAAAAAALLASSAGAWQAQDDLRAFAVEVQSASGTFSQKTIGVDGSVGEESSGEFAFLRPGFFKWNIEKPYVQKITGADGVLTIYDPDLMQATRHNSGAYLGATPASVLFAGDESALDAWRLDRCKSQADSCVRLSPRQESAFEWVEAEFSTSGMIDSMSVKDNFGQVIEVKFTSINKEALTESDFDADIPEGVDVIENLS